MRQCLRLSGWSWRESSVMLAWSQILIHIVFCCCAMMGTRHAWLPACSGQRDWKRTAYAAAARCSGRTVSGTTEFPPPTKCPTRQLFPFRPCPLIELSEIGGSGIIGRNVGLEMPRERAAKPNAEIHRLHFLIIVRLEIGYSSSNVPLVWLMKRWVLLVRQ